MEKGQVVKIFQNQQLDQGLLGVAKLIELKKTSLPYILEEAVEVETEVWVDEYWKIEWLYLTKFGQSVVHKENTVFSIRTLLSTGISPSKEQEQYNDTSSYLTDKFLDVDGIEIY